MRTIRRSFLAAACVACAHAAPVAPPVAEAPHPVEAPKVVSAAEKSARATVARVVASRGLAEKSPVKMEFHTRAELRQLVLAHIEKELTPADIAAERARWIAFGFTGTDADPGALAKSVMSEQVIGFYDPDTKMLHMPTDLTEGAPGSTTPFDKTGLTLAHEIEHSLQDQHFAFPDLPGLANDDAKLATMSLYEGDATFVMFQVMADQMRLPVGELLAGVMASLGSASEDAMLAMGGNSKELQAAPAVLRSQLLFPYFGGVSFLGKVYATGGLPLMNKVFEARPTTTEQVLHPEKYVAGEAAIPVAAPVAPPGTKIVVQGSLGELDLRTLLSCLGSEKAKSAAEGWGGDAFIVAQSGDGTLSLLWNTAWDTEADAVEFSEAIAAVNLSCWIKQVGQQSPKSDLRVAPWMHVVLHKDRRQVAVVRGLQDDYRQLAEALPPPGAVPPLRPPLGDIALAKAPAKVAPPPPSGRIEKGRWLDQPHGIQSLIPEGFEGDTTMPSTLFVLKSKEGTSFLTYVPLPDTASSRRQLLDAFEGQMKSAIGSQGHLSLVKEQEVKVAGASGTQRDLVLDGKPSVGVRVLAWSACDGKSIFGSVSSWSTVPGRAGVDAWIASLRVAPGAASACDGAATPASVPAE